MYLIIEEGDHFYVSDNLSDAKAYFKELRSYINLTNKDVKVFLEDNFDFESFKDFSYNFDCISFEEIDKINYTIEESYNLNDFISVCDGYAYARTYKVLLNDKNKKEIIDALKKKYIKYLLTEDEIFINFCNQNNIKVENCKIFASSIKNFKINLNTKEIYNDKNRILIPSNYSIIF